MNDDKAELHSGGMIFWTTRVGWAIGQRVTNLECVGLNGVLLGGNYRHAVIREDSGTVSAWGWSEITPLGEPAPDGPIGMDLSGALEDLPSALAELPDRRQEAASLGEAREAVAAATVEELARAWPSKSKDILGDAATSASNG